LQNNQQTSSWSITLMVKSRIYSPGEGSRVKCGMRKIADVKCRIQVRKNSCGITGRVKYMVRVVNVIFRLS